jgi:hypothetical protein
MVPDPQAARARIEGLAESESGIAALERDVAKPGAVS